MFHQKKIAIMGTGNIARTMARTIKRMKDVKCYAVASRELSRAEDFAREFGVKKAYGSYEEMVQDKKIDLIYIATPHSEHYANMKLCIENGQAVLCEKAFTANAKQAEEILKLAEENNVFVAEAIWTRYMPMVETIKGVLSAGTIGEITMMTCNLGYPLSHVQRMVEPQLAGGALLDLGVYPINFAYMMFGSDIKSVTSCCTKLPSGVDATDSITFTYQDGKQAVLCSNMLAFTDRKGIFYGSNGYIEVENINNFESLTVYDRDRKVINKINAPKQFTGYEYEVAACLEAIDDGKLECSQMPHAETLRVMRMMDSLRKEWGIRYPFEEEMTQVSDTSNPHDIQNAEALPYYVE